MTVEALRARLHQSVLIPCALALRILDEPETAPGTDAASSVAAMRDPYRSRCSDSAPDEDVAS